MYWIYMLDIDVSGTAAEEFIPETADHPSNYL